MFIVHGSTIPLRLTAGKFGAFSIEMFGTVNIYKNLFIFLTEIFTSLVHKINNYFIYVLLCKEYVLEIQDQTVETYILRVRARVYVRAYLT